MGPKVQPSKHTAGTPETRSPGNSGAAQETTIRSTDCARSAPIEAEGSAGCERGVQPKGGFGNNAGSRKNWGNIDPLDNGPRLLLTRPNRPSVGRMFDERLETPKELAARVNLSERQVRRLIQTRQLEHVMIGSRAHIPSGAFARRRQEGYPRTWALRSSASRSVR